MYDYNFELLIGKLENTPQLNLTMVHSIFKNQQPYFYSTRLQTIHSIHMKIKKLLYFNRCNFCNVTNYDTLSATTPSPFPGRN